MSLLDTVLLSGFFTMTVIGIVIIGYVIYDSWKEDKNKEDEDSLNGPLS